jgi:predicted 3-demethylubiquinone-9 3-methyltransferase (glyoxalase superfamily)
MSGITPHLWFDTQAKQAARFYTSTFGNSEISTELTLHDTPSGDCDVVHFTLEGQPFQAITAGPLFSFNPSISFLVNCETMDEVDALWKVLNEGGEALMPLDSYDFSDHFGWTQDRYGVSWQIMHSGDRPFTQKIVPTLMFVGDVAGRAEEAMTLYTSVFADSRVEGVMRHDKGGPDAEGTVRHASFTLGSCELAAMDSAAEHKFAFNEAISLMVHCDTQDEIDHYWERLSAVPESEQCGWLKDRFGVSWQIVPRAMDKMMDDADPETLSRVTQAFLKMKKFDIAELEAAYSGS